MLKTKEEIIDWLEQNGVTKYRINADMTIDVDDTVFLNNKQLTEIPVQFGIIKGAFYANNNYLTSFQGFPREAEDVKSNSNQITSLKDCPKIIKGTFNCQGNPIARLDNLPEYLEESMVFSHDDYKVEHFENLYLEDFNQLYLTLEEAKNVLLTKKLEHTLEEKNIPTIRIKI